MKKTKNKQQTKYELFHLFTKYSVAFFDDYKEWNKDMDINCKGQHKVSISSIGKALFDELEDGIILCIFINKKHYSYRHAIHEATHIVDFLMEYVGIDDTEFRAYTIEYLSVNIIEHCRDKYAK